MYICVLVVSKYNTCASIDVVALFLRYKIKGIMRSRVNRIAKYLLGTLLSSGRSTVKKSHSSCRYLNQNPVNLSVSR